MKFPHAYRCESVLAFLLFCVPLLYGQTKKPDEAKAQPPAAAVSVAPAAPVQEESSTTQHTVVLNGATLHYTATAGNLLIRDTENHPAGSMFYVAYTLDNATAKNRPITFLYNGGPGSSTIWLHMGSFGPVRVVTASPQATPPAPYQLVPNAYSLLDTSDLVFVDAIGTGFSHPVEKGKLPDFLGVDQDVRAFQDFISRYLTVNQRWNSPKFLIGESYGTTRSAALAYALQQSGIALNGVVLISSVLNFSDRAPGLDNDSIETLPSYAAIAWYHDKLNPKPAQLAPFLDQVRTYARGPYASALAQGSNIPQTERNQVAQRLSELTGVSAAYWTQSDLRVPPAHFRKELLRDERRTLGRYDARFEGMDMDASTDSPAYDPSETGISGAFVAAFHEYLAGTLNFSSNETYKATAYGPGFIWDWKHKPPEGEEEQSPDAALDLAAALRENPHLKVFSANGYFDLATPFFETEFDLAHMQLEPSLQKNIRLAYYPSGHMIYLNLEALQELKADLIQFYGEATTGKQNQ